MTDKEMRMERIERLLYELRHEVERGFMENEIDETIRYQFIVPVSRQLRGGVVWCRFETRPVHSGSIMGLDVEAGPRLKLVKG